MFVGGVRVFVGETEADKHARNFECVMHLRDERDGAAFADEHSFFPEAFLESALRNLEDGRVERGNPGLAGAEHVELALYGLRQEFANVFFDELRDGVRILARNEPRRKFRVGFRRDYCLRAFALIAAPHTIEFEGWARPELLDNGEAFFAEIAR